MKVMGDIQLEVLKQVIKERFSMDVEFGCGHIVYKETIENTVEGVGHFEPLRHYAEAHILLEPLPRGSGLQFDTVCSEDVLDKNWQRLIMTHLMEKQHIGVLTGSVITDMKMTILTEKPMQNIRKAEISDRQRIEPFVRDLERQTVFCWSLCMNLY